MARMPRMARTPRMARWLADYPDPFVVSCDSLRVKLHMENLHFLKRRFHFLLGVKSVTCKNGND